MKQFLKESVIFFYRYFVILMTWAAFLFINHPLLASLDTDFQYNSRITVSHTMIPGSTDWVNYPLMLDIESNTELRSTANGGKIESPNGWDIAFAPTQTSEAFEQFKFYIEKYDAATGKLIVWVQVTLSATENTEFYLFYGQSGVLANPSTSQVWTEANYIGVWPLSDTPGSGTVKDAAGLSSAGSAFGNVAIDLNGVLGSAYSFDGTGDYVTIPDNATIEPTGSFTISTWFKSNGSQNEYAKIFSKGRLSSPYASYTLEMRPNSAFTTYNREVGFQTGRTSGNHVLTDSNGNSIDDIEDGEWYYFVGIIEYTGATYVQTMYLNGVQISTASNTSAINYYNPTTYPLTIGGIYDGGINNEFNGSIDELRISSVARAPEYLNTEMNNLACGAAFITLENISVGCALPEILPITLTDFIVKETQGIAELRWSTSMEKNNDYFTLERSADGTLFEVIGKVPGAVNSAELLHYSYYDRRPLAGISYYRLKQTDLDGKFSYSKAISLTLSHNPPLRLLCYPNPAKEIVHIQLSEMVAVQLISLINSAGTTYKISPNTGKDGEITIDISSLPRGFYILQIETATLHYQEKLMLQ